MKLAIIGFVFLLAVGVLIVLGLEGTPVMKIQEVKAAGFTDLCRIDNGIIHSVKKGPRLEFVIHSEKDPNQLLRVQSERVPPPDFKPGRKVSVRGIFDPETQLFVADEVITDCPSRYEATKDSKDPTPAGSPGVPLSQKVP